MDIMSYLDISLPKILAIALSSFISFCNSFGVIAWSASHHASLGVGCISTSNPSAPAAIHALDKAATIQAFPPACEGSIITGR